MPVFPFLTYRNCTGIHSSHLSWGGVRKRPAVGNSECLKLLFKPALAELRLLFPETSLIVHSEARGAETAAFNALASVSELRWPQAITATRGSTSDLYRFATRASGLSHTSQQQKQTFNPRALNITPKPQSKTQPLLRSTS